MVDGSGERVSERERKVWKRGSFTSNTSLCLSLHRCRMQSVKAGGGKKAGGGQGEQQYGREARRQGWMKGWINKVYIKGCEKTCAFLECFHYLLSFEIILNRSILFFFFLHLRPVKFFFVCNNGRRHFHWFQWGSNKPNECAKLGTALWSGLSFFFYILC